MDLKTYDRPTLCSELSYEYALALHVFYLALREPPSCIGQVAGSVVLGLSGTVWDGWCFVVVAVVVVAVAVAVAAVVVPWCGCACCCSYCFLLLLVVVIVVVVVIAVVIMLVTVLILLG